MTGQNIELHPIVYRPFQWFPSSAEPPSRTPLLLCYHYGVRYDTLNLHESQKISEWADMGVTHWMIIEYPKKDNY